MEIHVICMGQTYEMMTWITLAVNCAIYRRKASVRKHKALWFPIKGSKYMMLVEGLERSGLNPVVWL